MLDACVLMLALCTGDVPQESVSVPVDEMNLAIIPELLPEQAHQRQRHGAILVDVREDDERTQGMAEGALGVPLAELAANPARYLPDQDAEVLLICRSGQRSLRAASHLLEQGYQRVFSVQGGTLRWEAERLPMQPPDAKVIMRP